MKVIYRSLIKVILYSAYLCLFSFFLLMLFGLLLPTRVWALSCPEGMYICFCPHENGYRARCCALDESCHCPDYPDMPSCGECFTGETEVEVGDSEAKQIKDLKEDEMVSSFNPETGEVKEETVSDVQELTREGYYQLETESGKKVKVTAEHPFLAVENESFIAKIKEVFSQTLTYRVITGLESKLSDILR